MDKKAHEAHIDQNDPYGKKIGVMASVIAVILSIFTIVGHRARTETIILQNFLNDQWSHYQAKRTRDYQLELNLDTIKLLASSNPNGPALLIAAYTKNTLNIPKN